MEHLARDSIVAIAAAVAVVIVASLAVDGGPDAGGDLEVGIRETASSTTSTTTAPTTTLPPTTTAPPATAPPGPPPAPPAPATPLTPTALCIGDSVMLGASTYFGTLPMCAVVDATVSRQVAEGPAAVQAHAPYPSTVIIHLGTNGTANAADLDAMLTALQGVPRVVLVTAQLNGTRSWEGQVNTEIAAAAQRFPNVRVADWKAASEGHPEYFREDLFHPTMEGAQVYVNVIAAAL